VSKTGNTAVKAVKIIPPDKSYARAGCNTRICTLASARPPVLVGRAIARSEMRQRYFDDTRNERFAGMMDHQGPGNQFQDLCDERRVHRRNRFRFATIGRSPTPR